MRKSIQFLHSCFVFFFILFLFSNHPLSFLSISICVLNLILFSLLKTLWWRNRSIISHPYANVVLYVVLPQTIHPYITRKQPIFIDSRSLRHIYSEIVIIIFSLRIWKNCWSVMYMLLAYSIIVIICHTISFNTISFVSFFFFFNRKFPIILLHFISLEFCVFLFSGMHDFFSLYLFQFSK